MQSYPEACALFFFEARQEAVRTLRAVEKLERFAFVALQTHKVHYHIIPLYSAYKARQEAVRTLGWCRNWNNRVSLRPVQCAALRMHVLFGVYKDHYSQHCVLCVQISTVVSVAVAAAPQRTALHSGSLADERLYGQG